MLWANVNVHMQEFVTSIGLKGPGGRMKSFFDHNQTEQRTGGFELFGAWEVQLQTGLALAK
jgi:hypothetical protein